MIEHLVKLTNIPDVQVLSMLIAMKTLSTINLGLEER